MPVKLGLEVDYVPGREEERPRCSSLSMGLRPCSIDFIGDARNRRRAPPWTAEVGVRRHGAATTRCRQRRNRAASSTSPAASDSSACYGLIFRWDRKPSPVPSTVFCPRGLERQGSTSRTPSCIRTRAPARSSRARHGRSLLLPTLMSPIRRSRSRPARSTMRARRVTRPYGLRPRQRRQEPLGLSSRHRCRRAWGSMRACRSSSAGSSSRTLLGLVGDSDGDVVATR